MSQRQADLIKLQNELEIRAVARCSKDRSMHSCMCCWIPRMEKLNWRKRHLDFASTSKRSHGAGEQVSTHAHAIQGSNITQQFGIDDTWSRNVKC